MQSFKSEYVNPARRDLLKQLVAIGALGTGSSLCSTDVYAADTGTNTASLALDSSWRKDPDYEDIRKAMLWRFNTPERYPDVIAHARNEEEIISALKFAADNDLQVVCRGSGHNTAGAILRNGGMMLDVSALNTVTVNAAEKTASVQPGARIAQLYQMLAEHNLAFPIAYCHTVALGGFLLGGGVGVNSQHWGNGPACYSVIDADVILSDGSKVTVSKDAYPEIYWAVRGVGPGFFGVVTRFTLKAYDHPSTILSNNYVHPIEALPGINDLFNKSRDIKDPRTGLTSTLYPSGDNSGKLLAHVAITAITGPGANADEEARSLLAPYQEKGIADGALSVEEYKQIPLAAMMFTPDRNERANTDNIFTDDTDALLAILDHAHNRPPNSSMYLSFNYNGQMFPFRHDACYSAAGRHHLGSRIKWYDPDDDGENYAWYKKFNEILDPYATGHYINEIDNENSPDRVRSCFSEENWNRLAEIREKYDPGSRFYSYLGMS